jgi:hypothetical protein
MILTPRTDAEEFRGAIFDCPFVKADFARELEIEVEIYRYERLQFRAQRDALIKHLSHIHAMLHAEPVKIEGKIFTFHPPDELVREAWEGLSRAIRAIPVEIADSGRARDIGKECRSWPR